MKKLKFPVFILMLLLQSVFCFAQQTKTPYTVTVFNLAPTNPLVKGTKITSNSQILANTTYYVEITSSTTATVCCMRITGADGFTTGFFSFPSLVWVNNTDPTKAQVDTGQPNPTMKFAIRTLSGADFVNQLFMRVNQSANAITWSPQKGFLFPYQ
jgi:hypothetical protein